MTEIYLHFPMRVFTYLQEALVEREVVSILALLLEGFDVRLEHQREPRDVLLLRRLRRVDVALHVRELDGHALVLDARSKDVNTYVQSDSCMGRL